ncbi:MAG: redoxin domain-containing protein, partial [bacterium]
MDQREIKVGDVAPDFTLKDQNGNDVKLSGLKGKKVVLGFHPLAWTSVCATQMKDLEASAAEFA